MEWRDEFGRGILHWSCMQDTEVRLIKWLVEEQGMRLEEDMQGESCLEKACERFLNAKREGVSKEEQQRTRTLIDYLIDREAWGSNTLHQALQT